MSLTAAICFSLGEKVGSMHAHTQLDFLAPFFWHFPIPADQIHNFCQSNSQTLEPDDFYGQSSQANLSPEERALAVRLQLSEAKAVVERKSFYGFPLYYRPRFILPLWP